MCIDKMFNMVLITGEDGSKYEVMDTPVTQELYVKVMQCNPSYFNIDANRPVECVSFYDAVEFCNKLSMKFDLPNYYSINEDSTIRLQADGKYGYRLLSNEEWEFIADDLLDLPDLERLEYGWFSHNSMRRTHSVRRKLPNKHGLYDLVGNVWEWTCTWRDGYLVLRGGAWDDYAFFLRATGRYDYTSSNRYNYIGFRCARTIDPDSTCAKDTKSAVNTDVIGSVAGVSAQVVKIKQSGSASSTMTLAHEISTHLAARGYIVELVAPYGKHPCVVVSMDAWIIEILHDVTLQEYMQAAVDGFYPKPNNFIGYIQVIVTA